MGIGRNDMPLAPDRPPLGRDTCRRSQTRQDLRIDRPGAAPAGRRLGQHKGRARRDRDGLPFGEPVARVVGAVAEQGPAELVARLRQDQALGGVPAVDRQDDAIQATLRRRGHDHHQGSSQRIIPLRRRELRAIRLTPGHVRIRMSGNCDAAQEQIDAEGWAPAPDRDQPPRKGKEPLVLGCPVHPADRIVLGIAVVVAALGASQLIAHGEHRRPPRQEQARQQRTDVLCARRQHLRIGGRPFRSVVPGQVPIGAVAAGLAVGVVVLGLEADQIGQGEAVMDRDEVDAA